MSTSPPYPGGSEPPRDAGPPYRSAPQPGQYPDPQAQYPGSQYPPGQYPPGQDPGPARYAEAQPYPGGQYPPGAAPYAGADPLVATSFSDWWTKVIGVLTRSWQPLLIIQLATMVPVLIIAAAVAAAAAIDSTVFTAGALIVALAGVIILIVGILLAQAASIYVVAKQAVGEEVDASAALRFAAGRAGAVLGWGLLAGLLTAVGLALLIIPGLYLMVVFYASLAGVIMFERVGIGRTFSLVNPAFGQTLGRLLSFGLAAMVYAAIVGSIVSALVGREGFVYELLTNILTLPISFALVGVGVVTYATLRNRENPAVTTPTLAAALDRPF